MKCPNCGYNLNNKFTLRQEQVYALIVMGLSNMEIATVLGLSFHTVSNHVNNLMNCTGLRTRHQLVMEYLRPYL